MLDRQVEVQGKLRCKTAVRSLRQSTVLSSGVAVSLRQSPIEC